MPQIIPNGSWLCAYKKVSRNLRINLFKIPKDYMTPIKFLVSFLICLKVFRMNV